jgi:glycosyltransferase involved in cell wall biosynthesis
VPKEDSESIVSVLIPIHNEAPHLEKALESVRGQDTVEIELVVVLDRPTVSLKAQTQLLLTDFKSTKLLISPGSGISEALNFGIGNCAGKYIARIDSDDEMSRDRLVKQKLFLDNNPQVSCVGTQITKVFEKNNSISRSHFPRSPFLLKRILRIRNCVAHPSVMYRREEIERVGGYRAAFDGAEDYDLWIRLTREGRIANLPGQLTKYRIWNGQDTAKYLQEKTTRAHQVLLFTELEEVAPLYSAELLSRKLNTESLIVAADEYLRQKARLRSKRLRSVLALNTLLSHYIGLLDVKSGVAICFRILHIGLLSFSIRIVGNR